MAETSDVSPKAKAIRKVEKTIRDELGKLLFTRTIFATEKVAWETSSHDFGTIEYEPGQPISGIDTRVRRTQPMVSLGTAFPVLVSELDSSSASNTALRYARNIADAETCAVFYGYPGASTQQGYGSFNGVVGTSPLGRRARPVRQPPSPTDLEKKVSAAAADLRTNRGATSIALALPTSWHQKLSQADLKGLKKVADKGVHHTGQLHTGVVLSTSGEHFKLTHGPGYTIQHGDDGTRVTFTIEDSITFRADQHKAIPLQ